jgi:hypothetical protein
MALHLISAHLIIVEILEPAAEVFGAKGGVAVGGAAGVLVDGVGDEDGAVGAQGKGDGVGGAGVEGYYFAGVVHPDGGVEGVLAEGADDDAGDAGVEAIDRGAKEVVGHGAGCGGLFDFEGDGIGFEEAYPDGEDDFAGEVVEDDDGHFGGGVHHEAADAHFDFWFGGEEWIGLGLEAGKVHGGSVTLNAGGGRKGQWACECRRCGGSFGCGCRRRATTFAQDDSVLLCGDGDAGVEGLLGEECCGEGRRLGDGFAY